MVYDADCGFCTRSAEFLERRSDCAVATVAVARPGRGRPDRAGRDHGGVLGRGRSYAAARGARDRGGAPVLPGRGYRVLGRLIDLPPVRPVAAWVYGLVARYRYHLPGGTNACQLP